MSASDIGISRIGVAVFVSFLYMPNLFEYKQLCFL